MIHFVFLLAALDDEEPPAPDAPSESTEPAPLVGEPSPVPPAPQIAPPPASSVAAAQRRYPSFEIALRSGVSFPLGGMAQGLIEPIAMDRVAGWQVPAMIDLGWRLSPAFFVGSYGAIAIGTVSDQFERDTCGANCSSLSFHVGVQAHVHLAPERRIDPWLGIGFGYESFTARANPSVDARGFEIARPTAGVDLRLSPLVAGGLFVDGTIAAYTSAESTVAGTTPYYRFVPFREEQDRAYIHSWVTFGIRFVFHGRRK